MKTIIDGNNAHDKNIVGYCKAKRGYLTSKLAKLHQCKKKRCCSYEKKEKEDIK